MGKKVDLTGMRFEKLLVIKRSDRTDKSGNVYWDCVCDCENEITVPRYMLCAGRTKSCGCSAKESASIRAKTHGKSNTRLYRIWSGMKNRCYRTNDRAYPDYGGRGIVMCDEWLSSFEVFYDWAMDNGYSDDLTLDRENNDKGYSPDNCRWATRKEQCNNTRSNVFIEIDGETKTISQWADVYNIDNATVRERINRGWVPLDAITQPIALNGKRGKKERIFIEIDGIVKTASEWARINEIDPKTATMRILRGWNQVDAVTIPALETGKRFNH